MSPRQDRSLASLLKVAVDVCWALSWIAFGAALLGLAAFAVTVLAGGEVKLGLVNTVADRESWQAIVPGLAVAVVYSAGLIVILSRLRLIFATLADGDPFVPDNAGRLRAIAWAVIVLELARYAIQAGTLWIVAAFGQPESGALEVAFRPSLAAWAAALVLFVLASVFREGARLRRQDQLTI